MSTDHLAAGGAIPAPPDGAEPPPVGDLKHSTIPPDLIPPDAIRDPGRRHPSTIRPQQEV